MTCRHCNDTGSIVYPYLDCAYCEVATIRARLNAMMLAGPYMLAPSEYTLGAQEACWAAYQRGAADEQQRIRQQENKNG